MYDPFDSIACENEDLGKKLPSFKGMNKHENHSLGNATCTMNFLTLLFVLASDSLKGEFNILTFLDYVCDRLGIIFCHNNKTVRAVDVKASLAPRTF